MIGVTSLFLFHYEEHPDACVHHKLFIHSSVDSMSPCPHIRELLLDVHPSMALLGLE